MIPKFRFWYEREDYYPDENYMRHVWGIEYIADNKIELNDDYIFNPYTNVAENIYAKTKIYLMQSTGLIDVNGVEIYEGDLVESDDNVDGTWETFEAREIVYDADYAQFCFESDASNFLVNYRNLRVVGNVWDKRVAG